MLVILWADRILNLIEFFRVGGAICVEIPDDKFPVTPVFSVSDTTTNSGIILDLIGSTRVQHDKGKSRLLGIPLASKLIAILAFITKNRASIHI